MKAICLSLLLGLMVACLPPASLTAPSAVEQEEESPCFRSLQCIVDTTPDNALRKEVQTIINTLMQTPEPAFSRICQARAREWLVSEPVCRQN
jgi:hypothetical protein